MTKDLCPECGGTGESLKRGYPCPTCNGTGKRGSGKNGKVLERDCTCDREAWKKQPVYERRADPNCPVHGSHKVLKGAAAKALGSMPGEGVVDAQGLHDGLAVSRTEGERKSNAEEERQEHTRCPVYLVQRFRQHYDESGRTDEDGLMQDKLICDEWETIAVFASRQEAERHRQSRIYDYGKDSRVFAVPAMGELVSMLEPQSRERTVREEALQAVLENHPKGGYSNEGQFLEMAVENARAALKEKGERVWHCAQGVFHQNGRTGALFADPKNCECKGTCLIKQKEKGEK